MARVLVVDDDQQLRRLVSKALKTAGHRPVEAENGHQAIAMARELRPAIVLLDLKLGDRSPDGLAVFRAIHSERSDVIGVMMTGYGSDAHALECGRAGMAGYLRKPFLPDDVVRTVTRALEERAARGRSAGSEPVPQTVAALLHELRALESQDVDATAVLRQLKLQLVQALTDRWLSVPLLLICGRSLGQVVASGLELDYGGAREMLMEIRGNIDKVMAIGRRPLEPEIAAVLARFEAAALDGALPGEGELARQVGRSRSQVSRGITSATGFPFLTLARGYRLRTALPAILMSREHIDRVALDAGYDDVRQFRRDFRAVFGMSARNFRRHQ